MERTIGLQKEVKEKLDELGKHPAATKLDRTEWLKLTQPVFSCLVRIRKHLELLRSHLAACAYSATSGVAGFCKSGQSECAAGLAELACTILRDLYSDKGVSMDELARALSTFEANHPYAAKQASAIKAELIRTRELEDEFLQKSVTH